MNPVDIGVIVKYLKSGLNGKKTRRYLSRRMEFQLEDPKLDPMTCRLLPVLKEFQPQLIGKILDVGCYTGFLYHHLGKPENYTGIDIWGDAIQVAKEFAPEANFRVADGLAFEGSFDVLWCSQIVWSSQRIDPGMAIEKLSKLAKKSIFVLTESDARSVVSDPKKFGNLCVVVNG